MHTLTPKQILIENNYLIINNFIDSARASEFNTLFIHDVNIQSYNDIQCPKSKAIYNYRWFVELLVEKAFLLSEILEEPILPTYTYARLYKYQEELKKHTDRESCEISVTLHLGSDGVPWPIYFTKPNGEVAYVDLKPGQAVLYLGMASEHWREIYTGNQYTQVFLHYVRGRGKYWEWVFDNKRQ